MSQPNTVEIDGFLADETRRQEIYRGAVAKFYSLASLLQQPSLPGVSVNQEPYNTDGSISPSDRDYINSSGKSLTDIKIDIDSRVADFAHIPESVQKVLSDLRFTDTSLHMRVSLMHVFGNQPCGLSFIEWHLEPPTQTLGLYTISLTNEDRKKNQVGASYNYEDRELVDIDYLKRLRKLYTEIWNPSHPNLVQTFSDGANWTKKLLEARQSK